MCVCERTCTVLTWGDQSQLDRSPAGVAGAGPGKVSRVALRFTMGLRTQQGTLDTIALL